MVLFLFFNLTIISLDLGSASDLKAVCCDVLMAVRVRGLQQGTAVQVNWPQLWTPRHKRYCYRIAGYLLLIITIAFPVGIFTGASSHPSLLVDCRCQVS